MHTVLCALPLALGAVFAVTPRARTAELPAIFAPRPVADGLPGGASIVRPPTATATAISERSRSLIKDASVRVLESVPVVDAPVAPGSAYVDAATGTMVMAPVVVRSQTLRDSDVRPLTPRLYHFTPVSGDKFRRVAGGATVPLYHTFIGNKELQVDFNVLNLGGKGIDHNIDFSRVELAFTLKW